MVIIMEDSYKKIIMESVEKNLPELKRIRTYLYENPEIGGTEEKASAALTDSLKAHGFSVEKDIHNIQYSFKAIYDSGKPGPVIGFTQEYDALPDIGHGCGHDIIAVTPMGAAFALKDVVDKTGGKIICFGTPGEENIISKATLSNEGAFDELDVAMTIHPNPENISSGRATAVDAWQVDFYGKSSHAGAHPEDGINALDAAVHFYTLIGFEKQYLNGTNIYGVFADGGGKKCSVIPDFAAVKYLVRAATVRDIRKIRELFERCAEAACKAVGTTYRIWNNELGNMDVVTNETLSDTFNKYYEEVGGGFMPHKEIGASTDMGDVSHRVPAIHPWLGLDCPELLLHSEEFAKETITEKADKVIECGAKALALTGLEVLTNPEFLKKVKEEFDEAKKSF